MDKAGPINAHEISSRGRQVLAWEGACVLFVQESAIWPVVLQQPVAIAPQNVGCCLHRAPPDVEIAVPLAVKSGTPPRVAAAHVSVADGWGKNVVQFDQFTVIQSALSSVSK